MVSIPFNNKTLFFSIRPEKRQGKITDLGVLHEIFVENVYAPPDLTGKNIIDLGANIGAFSIQAAALGANRVIAVEPNPANIEVLKENIANNNFETKIDVVEKAVSFKNGVMDFEDNACDSKVILAGKLESKTSKEVTGENGSEIFQAHTLTLSKLFEETNLDYCHFLKADVEWSEYHIFNNPNDPVFDKIGKMVFEFHGASIQTFGKLIAVLSTAFCVRTVGSYDRGGYLVAEHY